jgi:hypothetical protein
MGTQNDYLKELLEEDQCGWEDKDVGGEEWDGRDA